MLLKSNDLPEKFNRLGFVCLYIILWVITEGNAIANNWRFSVTHCHIKVNYSYPQLKFMSFLPLGCHVHIDIVDRMKELRKIKHQRQKEEIPLYKENEYTERGIFVKEKFNGRLARIPLRRDNKEYVQTTYGVSRLLTSCIAKSPP